MKLDLQGSWQQEIEGLCELAMASGPNNEVTLVRKLHQICLGGPSSICSHTGALHLSSDELERLLSAGAVESAAVRLVKPCGYMLSCGEPGIAIATVNFPSTGEANFSGDSETIALCGALATALSQAVRLLKA